ISPITQQQYISAFQGVLDLALKKRLIPANPAEGLKPMKRDTVAAGDKRKPFTTEQLHAFFHGKFYSECAKHPLPFAHDKSGWRVLVAVMCLYFWKGAKDAVQRVGFDLHETRHGKRRLGVDAQN